MLDFSNPHPRILVLGDLMVDHYIWGDSNRISPEAPVQVVDVKTESNRLGGACNVANNLRSLGAIVDLCGVIGKDFMGEWLQEELRACNITATLIHTDSSRPTIQKTRVVLGNQQVLRVDREEKKPISDALQEQILKSLRDQITHYDALILSDYNKGFLTSRLTQEIIALAKMHQLPILCDPKGVDYHKYKGATLLTPNKKEAQQATGIQIEDLKTLELAAKKMQEECQLDFALITLSEDGIGVLDAHQKILCVPTIAKEVFDVTGAGDTVIASLAFCLAQHIDIYDACRFANAAAAVVVGKVGSAVASLDEIRALVNFKESKIVTLDSLLGILRYQNKKVVFTNGCFDILHKGHLSYLQEAKALGDLLVVGLNTDRSVRALKGEERPINSQEDRAFMLSGFSCVDFVVLFDEDTPYELIRAIGPDILVKGADYEGKKVVGSEFAKQTLLLDFVEGKSTSAIIKKIKG